MAWRIDEQVVRGEIDNRTRGKTTGRIWFVGRAEPVTLTLDGNPWRDLAGHVLRFSNPAPKPGLPEGLADEQRGSVGDITASRGLEMWLPLWVRLFGALGTPMFNLKLVKA